MGREVIYLGSKDIQQDDASGYDKFKDVTLTANVMSTIGEHELGANIKQATWGGGKLYIVLYDDTTTQAREEGTFIFSVVGPSGAEQITHRVTSYAAGPNGKTADTDVWHVMGEGGKYTVGGGKLRLSFVSAATDIIDTTDNYIYSLPCVIYT